MEIKVNAQSSIKVITDKIIYFDPFKIKEESHDADIIFITHDHYDHFSIDDIKKVEKEDTLYVIPECMINLLGGMNVVLVSPDEKTTIDGIECEVLPAYYFSKQFHPKEKGYISYIVTIDGKRIYVAGDNEKNEDNINIICDIALVPVGGHYTMDYMEAADLINNIKPDLVIPTHYSEDLGGLDTGIKFKELIDSDIEVELLLD